MRGSLLFELPLPKYWPVSCQVLTTLSSSMVTYAPPQKAWYSHPPVTFRLEPNDGQFLPPELLFASSSGVFLKS
jgi:hypothetical protein